MEEADLRKERLQAITDKRRVQENIAMKRRQIEEEKLKLQYMKKKALREQWLMDGQQSEEEQQAMRLQAQEEQLLTTQLQDTILRIEGEMEALETQELSISANEEAVLRRLKEVERTTADIIKEVNAEFQPDVISPLPDMPSIIPKAPARKPPPSEADRDQPKKATFAMEISVEHDKRTGKSQVVSKATITPEAVHGRGLKVYDDGHKSVYALPPEGGKADNGPVGEMTRTELDDLLHQATDENVPTEVKYHQPVYSAPYTSGSRPSTPRGPNKTPSPSPFHSTISSPAPGLTEEDQKDEELEGWKTPSPSLIQQDSQSKSLQRSEEEETKLPYFHIPGKPHSDTFQNLQPYLGARTPPGLTDSKPQTHTSNPAALVSVKARTDGMPAPSQPVYRTVDEQSPSPACRRSQVDPDASTEGSGGVLCAENTPTVSPVHPLPEQLQADPVTMIFMGFETAQDEEEDDIHAEVVIIGEDDDDDEEAQCATSESDQGECLSYHPEGYKSKVFQPKVGVAKVTDCGDIIGDAYANMDDLGLHKPTFIHKPGKHSPYLQAPGPDQPNNTGSINMEKMKLCSTGR